MIYLSITNTLAIYRREFPATTESPTLINAFSTDFILKSILIPIVRILGVNYVI